MIEQKPVAVLIQRNSPGNGWINVADEDVEFYKSRIQELRYLFTESQLKAEVDMKDKIIKSLSNEVKSLEMQLVKLLNKQSHEEPKV
jgi:hypothetical protein